MSDQTQERIEQLVNFIMKNCLWQFHSRKWDRERQNAEILKKTCQLLCNEEVDLATPMDRCYWVDAVYLVDNFKRLCPWLAELKTEEIKILMQGLKERMDFLTITGSLNEELIVPLY